MQYFTSLNKLLYKFGNEETTVAFQDISTYIDIIDQIKDAATFYWHYDINEGYRPDQLSLALYGTPLYYWTFFLMNDKLRLQGWPLSNEELDRVIKREYPHRVVTTRNDLSGIFKTGQTVTGSSSGATGRIAHRHLDLGQIMLDDATGTFRDGEQLQSTAVTLTEDIVQSITIVSSEEEYNAAHHYEDVNGKIVDIDPYVGPGAQLTEITNYQRYFNENEDLKRIKIIKPDIMSSIITNYKKALRT
jgi:exonuclease VII small subunit